MLDSPELGFRGGSEAHANAVRCDEQMRKRKKSEIEQFTPQFRNKSQVYLPSYRVQWLDLRLITVKRAEQPHVKSG